MTDAFDSLILLFPMVTLGHAAYRAFLNPVNASAIFRRGFLISGVALFLLSLIEAAGFLGRYFSARPETSDIAVKAGFGMMIAALVCAVVEHGKRDHKG
ncbi:hypothetical protein IMZ11_13075 [Microtetraspora sp. AC03309]|uniref:hypothetical protein n=1 Tax=Microtetraspora sp. AC03309 TaxID=2779376 RepID=UPI001E4EC4AB|nr:hypothetical protein [Microtetraspora sp. AC03309]MCC5576562.1 hypothetical protein [Microtetraspora sp. AC03309]